VKAAAARGENARKNCLICLLNFFCRQINFSGHRYSSNVPIMAAEGKENVGVAKDVQVLASAYFDPEHHSRNKWLKYK
jgi:hypothetical protein